MALVRIPSPALPGFESISEFTPEQAQQFATFLGDLPAGIKFKDIATFLNTELGLSTLPSQQVVQTLISFRSLLEPANVDFGELSAKLADSYKEAREGKTEMPSEKVESLKANLLLIFKNSKNLKLTLKADKLLSDDDSLYSESRIITDIRLVFNDDLNEKTRNAILVHRLNIEYTSANKTNNFYISMTLNDLKNLKDVIERAILKEELINKDYGTEIHFIESNH